MAGIERGTVSRNGKRLGYYVWGKSGKKYYYTPGNNQARKTAKTLARKQGEITKARNAKKRGRK